MTKETTKAATPLALAPPPAKPATPAAPTPAAPTPAKAATPAAPAPKAPTPPPAPAPKPMSQVTGPTHPIPESVDPLLVAILCWPRKHDTPNERLFCAWLRSQFKAIDLAMVCTEHSLGAMSVTIPIRKEGHADVESTTLFSCHVDTVDGAAIQTGARKKLDYDTIFGDIMLAKDSEGDCLGADDGAGIWLMLRMIKAQVPGTYLFHRGEECGGLSAKIIASAEKPWLKKFECAIAFDRPRDSEVITHQGGTRCASDKFGNALAAALNKHGMSYSISTLGAYTDTKEYRGVVAECVNIGVGYAGQHGKGETQDYAHLNALLDACLKVNWDTLPIDRNPTIEEPQWQYPAGNYYERFRKGKKSAASAYDGWNGQRGFDDLAGFDDDFVPEHARQKPAAAPKSSAKSFVSLGAEAVEAFEIMTFDEILAAAADDPDLAAYAIAELMRRHARDTAEIALLNRLAGMS